MAMTRARGIDRMGQQDDAAFDPGALLLDDGTLIPGSESGRAQLALENQVERRRQASGMVNRTGMTDNLDGYFGALQAKENYAQSRGGNARIDLMGRGPGTGTGFGNWEANVNGGNDVNLDDPAGGQQLAEAGAAAQAAQAVQMQRQNEAVRPAPYSGPFSQQGPSPEVLGMADAAQGAQAAAANMSARRMTPPPTVRRTTARPSAPVNRPQGTQTYSTPR